MRGDTEEAGETALPLRSSVTLARGPVFGSQHQVEFLTTTYNSSSKETYTLFCTFQDLYTCSIVHTHTHTEIWLKSFGLWVWSEFALLSRL